MKETKIAKELIDNIGCDVDKWREQETHKQTCQRWLEFLEGLEYDFTEESKDGLINKQLDLKQAIGTYEDAGI